MYPFIYISIYLSFWSVDTLGGITLPSNMEQTDNILTPQNPGILFPIKANPQPGTRDFTFHKHSHLTFGKKDEDASDMFVVECLPLDVAISLCYIQVCEYKALV